MGDLTTIILVSWAAGIAAFLGGLAARFEGSPDTEAKQELVHGVVAFGGGILLAAVAFALAPKGIAALTPAALTGAFLAGGFVFYALDLLLHKRGESSAQFMAMLMDFVPEAISLGAVFAEDRRLGMLLAVFIVTQNLPEGFNSYREMVRSGNRSRTILLALFGVSFLGPLAASAGYLVLQEQPKLTAAVMVFAAGGITYLVFQDIAPQSTMRRHWLPPLGAVFGFALGMVARQVIE